MEAEIRETDSEIYFGISAAQRAAIAISEERSRDAKGIP